MTTNDPTTPLPTRLQRLTVPEQLDAAVDALGAAAVRPLVDEGDGFCDAARALRDRSPWWGLLSDVLGELARDDVDHAWNLLRSRCSTCELWRCWTGGMRR